MGILKSPRATELLNTLPEAAKTGAAPNALFSLVLARQSEFLLTQEFPGGAPPVQETNRWFSFLSRAIELMLLVNEIKESSFKSQLVRQLAQGNPLAIDLCVRSLIEHRATVAVLPQRLASKWIKAARSFQPGANLPSSIQAMDDVIAKLLSGRRKSVEPLLPFATREDGKPIVGAISLPTLIADAFEKSSAISKGYNIASAAIHGRIDRGKELLRDRSGSAATKACLTGLIILDWICHIGGQKEYWYPAMRIMIDAKHAARQSNKIDGQDRRKVRQLMGLYEGNLRPGKDYTGDGTKVSPIVFGEHLLYFSAVRHFLEQMKTELLGPPMLDQDDCDRLCERYAGQARDWWFAIPNHPLLDWVDGESTESA
jgi:hypothetical protein